MGTVNWETVFFAIAVGVTIGVLLGLVIGFAAKVFAVEVDPRIEEVEECLPGANCGGCGFAGCSDFAKAVVAGDAPPDACPVCSADMVNQIAKVLGVEAGGKEKQVAVVLCGGNNTEAKKKAEYNGVSDCKSAMLIAGGPKGCTYGCMGLGTCAKACPFGAIEISDGLAVVHPEICVGCGKCVEACPKNIIKMVPAKAEVHVFCSSPEKGAPKKKKCNVACIGCRKCVKAADEGQMLVEGFLVQTNYENPPSKDIIEAAACPTGCLGAGKSSQEAV